MVTVGELRAARLDADGDGDVSLVDFVKAVWRGIRPGYGLPPIVQPLSPFSAMMVPSSPRLARAG